MVGLAENMQKSLRGLTLLPRQVYYILVVQAAVVYLHLFTIELLIPFLRTMVSCLPVELVAEPSIAAESGEDTSATTPAPPTHVFSGSARCGDQVRVYAQFAKQHL